MYSRGITEHMAVQKASQRPITWRETLWPYTNTCVKSWDSKARSEFMGGPWAAFPPLSSLTKCRWPLLIAHSVIWQLWHAGSIIAPLPIISSRSARVAGKPRMTFTWLEQENSQKLLQKQTQKHLSVSQMTTTATKWLHRTDMMRL